jgi:hypothetical protein
MWIRVDGTTFPSSTMEILHKRGIHVIYWIVRPCSEPSIVFANLTLTWLLEEAVAVTTASNNTRLITWIIMTWSL